MQTAKPQDMEIISQIERKKKKERENPTSRQIPAMNFCKEGNSEKWVRDPINRLKNSGLFCPGEHVARPVNHN